MKKSSQVKLTLVAAAGLAACGRNGPIDPCSQGTFNEQACQDAVQRGGYSYNGSWVPMYYSHPYPWYYDSYRGYTMRGGTVRSAPSSVYSAPAGSTSGVTRGGFGETGAAHASGSAGHGGGE